MSTADLSIQFRLMEKSTIRDKPSLLHQHFKSWQAQEKVRELAYGARRGATGIQDW